jgi:hypothetical protein
MLKAPKLFRAIAGVLTNDDLFGFAFSQRVARRGSAEPAASGRRTLSQREIASREIDGRSG